MTSVRPIDANRGRPAAPPWRMRRAGALAAALAGVAAAAAVAGCGSSSSSSSSGSTPAAAGGGSYASQTAASNKLAQFSQCVRAHGVPSFPDPNPNSAFPWSGAGVSQLGSPLGRAAFKACHSLFPKIGPQISLG